MSGPLVEDGCHVLHVEVVSPALQAAVAHRPELHGLPVVVHAGGTVVDASAAALASGVRTGEPLDVALVRCGRAVPVEVEADAEPDLRLRAALLSVLTEITPLVEPAGPVAAFVDVGGAVRRLGSPARIAWLVRDRMRERHGVGCAVGVGATKVVARLAGAAAGPDGVLLVPRAASTRFLGPQPVGALAEVSGPLEVALAARGIHRLDQLATASRSGLREVVGAATGRFLQDLAWGRDARPVVPPAPDADAGGLHLETGCAGARGDRSALEHHVRDLARDAAAALRARGRAARCAALTVETADGAVLTRTRTLGTPTRGAHEIQLVARAMLAEMTWAAVPERLRLDLGALRPLPGDPGLPRVAPVVAPRGAPRGDQGPDQGVRTRAAARDGSILRADPGGARRVTLVPRSSTTTIVTADIS